MPLQATYYDGQSAARYSVNISIVDAELIVITAKDFQHQIPLREINFPPHIGNTLYTFYLPQGAACETTSYEDLMAMLPSNGQQQVHSAIHRWENTLPLVGVALVLAVLLVWAFMQYGIPMLARDVAKRIPPEMETALAAEAMEILDSHIFEPSKLPPAKQQSLRNKFHTLAENPGLQIEFRHSEKIGANAFALPGGTMVFTDGLVNLAEHENEVISVFFHELGHVQQRHIMQRILENSFTALMLVLLTGDVGSASSLAATMPTLLLQAQHSRKAELEADSFAADALKQLGISPEHLGNMLERLEQQAKHGQIPDFLSSHPSTSQRKNFLKDK